MSTTVTEPTKTELIVPVHMVARAAWYRYRWMMAIILAVNLAAAGVLVWEGLSMRSWLAAHGLSGCVSTAVQHDGGRCGGPVWDTFINLPYYSEDLAQWLLVLPALTGMFAGVRWLTREYESGSYRYTWAQAVSPARWAAGTWLPLALVSAVGAVVCGWASAWWYQVAQWSINEPVSGGWGWETFGLSPLPFASLSVLALALGALVAAVIRRTLPAMAALAAAYGAVLIVADWPLRSWLITLAPVTTRADWEAVWGGNSARYYGSLFLRGWYTGKNGHVVPGWVDKPGQSYLTGPGAPSVLARIVNTGPAAVDRWLGQHGYTYWISYQPHARLWLFQAAWSVALLACASIATFIAFHQVHKRLRLPPGPSKMSRS